MRCGTVGLGISTTGSGGASAASRGRTFGMIECGVFEDQERLIARSSSTVITLRGEIAQGRLQARRSAQAGVCRPSAASRSRVRPAEIRFSFRS